MKRLSWSTIATPAGTFAVAASARGLVSVLLPGRDSDYPLPRLRALFPGVQFSSGSELTAPAADQIRGYFNGTLQAFTLDLDPGWTLFQKDVLSIVRTIPFGKTMSYGQIARKLGKPGAARAVGGANHANPLPLIIPCHRVIGADGSLTGFGAGLGLKAKLLEWEKEVVHAEESAADTAAGFDWTVGADRHV